MARATRASKQKRRRTALPALGAAGVSLAMGGGASAIAATANVPHRDTELRPVITLDEEEISDVSLATFYVFDKETTGTSQFGQGVQLAAGRRGCGCRGCAARGCRGCGCAGCRGCVARGCEPFGGEAAEVAAVIVAGRGEPAETARLERFPISLRSSGPDLMRIGPPAKACLQRCPRGCAGQIYMSWPSGWSKLSGNVKCRNPSARAGPSFVNR
jgi:hypothetical protein